jgi:SET domain-containing protein
MSGTEVAARPSRIAGLGLFALRAFASGERLARYTGTFTSQPPAPSADDGRVYGLEISPGRWLDGSSPENLGRHANHSCAPNAELTWAESPEQAWLTATQTICAGDEITFDYGFSLADSLAQPCRCGHPECVGRIIAAPLRGALRRHLRFSRPRD